MSKWVSEFSIDLEHRPSICGICFKSIPQNIPRLKITVERDYGNYLYNKFFHLDCVFREISVQLKDKSIRKHKDKLIKVREQYNLVKRLERFVTI